MTDADAALSLPLLDFADYRISGTKDILTPALAIYPDIVDSNIRFSLDLLNNDPSRWRPHIKTAKLQYTIRRYVEFGVGQFKCSTSLELLTACRAGASDVLIAYPLVGANARRVREIASDFQQRSIAARGETAEQIEAWSGSAVGLFIDVNPGMDRTGVSQVDREAILNLAGAIVRSGQAFRGLHYYDGHLGKFDLEERRILAHRGYDRLLELVAALEKAGLVVQEVITAGTPAFPCTLSYDGFINASFVHRASPGTVIYTDCTSLAQLPGDWAYRPAAVVVSAVVSRPAPGRVTCDAGHKTVSADAGSPTCAVIGRPDLVPAKPS